MRTCRSASVGLVVAVASSPDDGDGEVVEWHEAATAVLLLVAGSRLEEDGPSGLVTAVGARAQPCVIMESS